MVTGPAAEGSISGPALACEPHGRFMSANTTDVAKVTCPKCSAIVNKQRLADLAEAGTVLVLDDMGDMPANHGYRYAYRAMLNGLAVGVVGFDGAYGGGRWYVMPLRSLYMGSNMEPEDADDFAHTRMLTGCRLEDRPDALYRRELSFASKEAALAAVPDLVGTGRLLSAAEESKRSRDHQARVLQRRAEAVDEKRAEREAFESVVRGLTSLRERVADLSNEEAAALETAVAAYQRRVADPSDF
jgi:hypothetical protein